MVSKIAQFILFYRELINYKKKLAGLFLFLIYYSGIILKKESERKNVTNINKKNKKNHTQLLKKG